MNNLFIAFSPIASLAGRILISALFIMGGVSKIQNYAGTAGYFESLGLPTFLLPAVIALEAVGGLAILLGWQTRFVAFLLAGFTLMTSFIAHSNFADQVQMLMFMKNAAIAGGFLFLVADGAGTISLDHKFSKSV